MILLTKEVHDVHDEKIGPGVLFVVIFFVDYRRNVWSSHYVSIGPLGRVLTHSYLKQK